MKFIYKHATKEPLALKKYRETTPEATYSGFMDVDNELKIALLIEQGYLCAYCMGRISMERNMGKPKIEVEHYKSQAQYPDYQLDYANMLGVCNGNMGGKEHCDKSKKNNALALLNPLQKDCETYLTYSTSGDILAQKTA